MQKPRHCAQLTVPEFGSADTAAVLQPNVVEARWTRNGHQAADELVLTIPYKEGGVDPRMMKNAHVAYWLWDDELEDFDQTKHLCFTGICKKAKRRLSESGWVVDITFHDYTTLFISMKPLGQQGIPEWSDTLRGAWERICDNTGWLNPENRKIVSSVSALRNRIDFSDGVNQSLTLGAMTNERFLKLSKPQPKTGASAWDVWQWCCSMLGLLSFIDKDTLHITTADDYYRDAQSAQAIYGYNIFELEEETDNEIASKGILLKSYDHLTNRILEAFYPPPGDDRLKIRRSAAKPKSEGGTAITANEVSADYDEFSRYDITDQAALDRAAKQVYDDRCRQELQGSFRTADMTLPHGDGDDVPIYLLRPGDSLTIAMEPELDPDSLLSLSGEDERVAYLTKECGYDYGVARLIARNIDYGKLSFPSYHIKSMQIELTSEKFEAEVKFHNIIFTNE